MHFRTKYLSLIHVNTNALYIDLIEVMLLHSIVRSLAIVIAMAKILLVVFIAVGVHSSKFEIFSLSNTVM